MYISCPINDNILLFSSFSTKQRSASNKQGTKRRAPAASNTSTSTNAKRTRAQAVQGQGRPNMLSIRMSRLRRLFKANSVDFSGNLCLHLSSFSVAHPKVFSLILGPGCIFPFDRYLGLPKESEKNVKPNHLFSL